MRVIRPMRMNRMAGVLVAAALVLSGCSDDDDASNASNASDTSDTSTASAATAGADPAASVSTDSSAPLATDAADTTSAPAETAAPQPGAITDSTTPPASAAPSGPTAPPTTGDINEVVEAAPVETLPPTPLSDPVEVAGTARLEIVSVARVDAEARLPGEIAGPALAVTVAVANTTDAPLDLAAVTVNLADAAGLASAPLTTAPNAPLEGELAPGENAEGVYLFDFGAERSEPITVEVSAAVGTPIAVFSGPVPA